MKAGTQLFQIFMVVRGFDQPNGLGQIEFKFGYNFAHHFGITTHLVQQVFHVKNDRLFFFSGFFFTSFLVQIETIVEIDMIDDALDQQFAGYWFCKTVPPKKTKRSVDTQ